MKVGIIGMSNITLDFANRATMSGYEVLISHIRDNNVLNEAVKRTSSYLKLVDMAEVAKAEIIILSVSREDIETLIQSLPDMTEKIILHTNNVIFNLEPTESKLPEICSTDMIASLLPTAHVVKVFSTVEPMIILPYHEKQNSNEIFYIASNEYIKIYVRIFLESLDFTGQDLTELNQFNTLN